MIGLSRHTACAVTVFAVLAAGTSATAQTATSFQELRQLLQDGQVVVVVDSSGRHIKGKVSEVSPSSLVLLVPEARSFAESTVREIRASDSWREGAFIGAGIGAGFALWDYLIDPSEPGNAVIFTVAVGAGAAIGAGVDALIGRRVLYRSGSSTVKLTIAPVVTADRHGALISVLW